MTEETEKIVEMKYAMDVRLTNWHLLGRVSEYWLEYSMFLCRMEENKTKNQQRKRIRDLFFAKCEMENVLLTRHATPS